MVKQYEKLLDEIHTEEPEYEYEYLFVQQNDGVLLNPVAYKEGNEREQNKKKTEIIIQKKMSEFRQKNLSLSKLLYEQRKNIHHLETVLRDTGVRATMKMYCLPYMMHSQHTDIWHLIIVVC